MENIDNESGSLDYYNLLGKVTESIDKLQLRLTNDPAVSVVLTELINLVLIHDGLIRNCFDVKKCKSLREEFSKRVMAKELLTKKDDVPPSSVDQFLRLRERLVSSDESLENLVNLDVSEEEKKKFSSPRKEGKLYRPSKEKIFKMSAKKLKQEYMFFYDSHYARRFCAKFFASQDDQDLCVGCGFTRDEHVKMSTPLDRWVEESVIWRKEFHIVNKTYQMNTFKIRITDEPASIDKTANITILGSDIHPSVGLTVLLQKWKIPLPDFIISVIGSNQEVPINTKQMAAFAPGFANAVKSSNTWVIGGGTLHGVDKLITECVKSLQIREWMGTSDKRFHFLGITNWDCFEASSAANKFYFGESDDVKDLNFDKPFRYFVKKRHADFDEKTQRLSFTLNPFFTNFVAVQGGIKGKVHQELPVRIAIENILSNPFLNNNTTEVQSKSIPLAILLVGGDCGSLEHVAMSLSNDIPVIVCQGSGGIADIILGALRMASGKLELVDYQKYAIIKCIKDLINNPMGEKQLFSPDYIDAATHMHNITVCIEKRHLITVYRLDKPMIGAKLDQCILKALLTGRAAQQYDPVTLGLKWGKCEKIIQNLLISEGNINSRSNIRQLCRTALVEDKTDFFDLFLALDLDLSRYATVGELRLLYSKSMKSQQHLKKMFEKNGSFRLEKVYDVIFRCSSSYENFSLSSIEIPDCLSVAEAAQELFWWSVFNKRIKLSTFLWKRTHNKLANALIAVALCKSCQKHIPISETFHHTQFVEMQNLYESYSLNLLDKVWQFNETLTKALIMQQICSPINTSVFDIALCTTAKDFVCHTGFQACVEEFWTSNLNYSLFRVLFDVFVPFMAVHDMRKAEEAKRDIWANKPRSTNSTQTLAFAATESVVASLGLAKTGQDPNVYAEEVLLEVIDLKTNSDSSGHAFNRRKKPFFTSMASFYRTPVVKFLIHLLAFLVFLPFNSWCLAYYFKSCPIEFPEYVILLYNIVYLVEALVLVLQFRGPMLIKMQFWFRCEWNYIQVASSSLGILGFLTKMFCHQGVATIGNATILYGLSGFFNWMRLLSFYRCSRRLGPLWILIRKMMLESLGFMLIFSTISMAAGIFIQILMDIYRYEDQYSGSLKWLWLRPFFMFSGENFLKLVANNSHYEEEREGRFVTIYATISVFYFLLGNALMINLLVAIFSEIFNKVFVRSDSEFKNEMLMLTKEYENKTILPAPFVAVEIFFKMLRFAWNQSYVHCRRHESGDVIDREDLQIKANKRNVISHFESKCSKDMLAEMDGLLSPEEKVQHALESIDSQQSKLADMNLLVQEIDRLLMERFHNERIRKYGACR